MANIYAFSNALAGITAAVCMATAPDAGAAVDLGNLLTILDNTPDGGWASVSKNSLVEAWPDRADRPRADTSYADPSRVAAAWSSFAWDSNRGQIILFGGGHANYAGNEVYTWSGVTQRWERATLPSQVEEVSASYFIAIDGAEHAPPSMHTYDNTSYLAAADRYLVLGGGSFNSGFLPSAVNPDGSLRSTGPYFWDPSKADGSKVGGSTGSGVNPATLGSDSWNNRDNRNTTLFNQVGHVDGTSAATVENGKSVVYFTGPVFSSTDQWLYKYVVNDVNDSSQDVVSLVGKWRGGAKPYGAAGYDPESGLYVTLGNQATPQFVAWETRPSVPATENNAVTFTPTFANFTEFLSPGLAGIDYSPELDAFLIWSGSGSVWQLKAPTSGVLTDEWTMTLVTDGSALDPSGIPDRMDQSGVRGKWNYIPNLHAFMGMEGNETGEVWLYRPVGWTNPVPEPETAWLLGGGLMLLVGRRLMGRSSKQ